MKNTLLCRFASPGELSTRYGVAYAIAQLRSQLDAVVMESDFARTFNGKISPVTTLTRVSTPSYILRRHLRYVPGARTPAAGKEEDVEADECNQRILPSFVCEPNTCANARDDELTHGHSHCAKDEQGPTAPRLNHVEAWERRGSVDCRCGHLHDKRVLDSGMLEE